MAESLLAGKSERLTSLDAFRGTTIALMVLVNNPGSWGQLYKPVAHAHWDGWTPTDFVFPFFLFIVGVAMTFSFDKRREHGQGKGRLIAQVIRRSIIIFLLGLLLGAFPEWGKMMPYLLLITGLGFFYADEPVLGFTASTRATRNKLIGIGLILAGTIWFMANFGNFTARVPGVLARIAVCYFFASFIVLYTGIRGRVIWTAAILLIYYLVMKFIDAPASHEFAAAENLVRDAPPDAPFTGRLNDWIDVKLLGDSHLYRHRPDPEGILSTIPAIATVLLGVLAGNWLKSARGKNQKALGLVAGAVALLIIGQAMHYEFPINKKIWSSSFVVFMAGWSLVFLAIMYWIMDIWGKQKWAMPLLVFGTNAIFIFFMAGIGSRLLSIIKVDGVSLKSFLYGNYYTSWIEPPKLASLCWAISYILLWLLLTYPLYRKKIFIKV